MIKFRQKDFTIPEGHYTGPKDIDKVPGVLEMVGKSALGGIGLGAVVGSIMKDSSAWSGAKKGAKYGTIAGLILKFFLNYLHNPMSSVKFQTVDKNIRREFGVYSIQGITVGNNISKRAEIDEKFSINDRNVTNYKINFAIQNNRINMYTFGLTDKELDKVSNILDYYCKIYYGMDYDSFIINKKVNAYSVAIIFTNYQVISNFMMELSNELGYKINLLDNRTLVDRKLTEGSEKFHEAKEEERDFSVKSLNKYDLMKVIGTSGVYSLRKWLTVGSKKGINTAVLKLILGSLEKLGTDKLVQLEAEGKISKINNREEYSNKYLEYTLKKLHQIEGINYTVGEKNSEINISLVEGLFILTVSKSSDLVSKVDKTVYDKNKLDINRVDTGNVIVYTYPMKSKNDFEYLIKRLMSLRLVPNIFEG